MLFQTNILEKIKLILYDYTSTPMGKRLLKQRILNPILSPEELTIRYEIIGALQKKLPKPQINKEQNTKKNIELWKLLEDRLRQTTYDIERLQRRIMIKTIQPYELYNLDLAYHTIQEIFTILGESDIPIILEKLLPTRETLEQFITFTTNFQKTFDMESILKFHLNNIESSLFQEGIYPEIDNIQNEMTEIETLMDTIAQTLSNYIKDKGKTKTT